MSVLSLLFLFVSCSEKPNDTGDSGETDPIVIDDSGTPEEYTQMTGNLVYADGTTIDAGTVRVQMCDIVCMNGTVNGDGSFIFSYLQPGTYAFDVVPLADGDYATPLDFIEVTEEDIALQTPITIPTFATKAELTMGTVAGDDGLSVDIDPTTFVPREGAPNDLFFASVSVGSETVPLPLTTLPVEGEIIRVWYLGAFDAHTTTPWPFRLEGLTDMVGEMLHFFNGDLSEKQWIDLGTSIVDENGLVESPDGIHQLSILVVVREE